MTPLRLLTLLNRALFVLFSLATSVYCMLAYLPFTYQQVVRGKLLPQVNLFAEWHPLLQLVFTLLLVADLFTLLRPAALRAGSLARFAAAIAALQIAATVVCLASPVLSRLENSVSSFALGLVALLPALLVCALRLAERLPKAQWQLRPPSPARLLAATCLAALLATGAYAISECLRKPAEWQKPAEALALGACLHLVLFTLMYLVLDCAGALTRAFRLRGAALFAVIHVLFAALVWRFLFLEICRPLGVPDRFAHIYAALIGLTLSLLNASLALAQADLAQPLRPFDAALSAFHFGALRKPIAAAAGIALAACAAIPAGIRISLFDWNHMFGHILVLLFWAVLFAVCFSLTAPFESRRFGRLHCLALVFIVLGGYKALEAAGVIAAGSEERWAPAGESSQLAAGMLLKRPASDDGFYKFLAENTNLPRSLEVKPASVDFVPSLAEDHADNQADGHTPHPSIFIVTVDSLRRDYLSPYNPAVSFTPSIAAFASESEVFRNAFTHYGGTGLSEPSIWSGALMLHKQYVTPFAPTNALEKLLRATHYRTHISRDTILSALLTQSPDDDDLDAAEQSMSYDLGRSLAELQTKLERNPPEAGKPVFAYTQPQNLHISVIQREGASVPAGETYSGFYAPYASRLHHIDAAFGKFIAFLKARGIYDNSIVILTADHGDSLGEDGRWGHAYTIFPEIVRIPLIVHLPPSLRSRFTADPAAVAFSTGIAPTLYELLGYRTTPKDLYGTSFFRAAPPARPDPAARYFIASSYGAVYGVLSNNGTRLYIANAIEYSEQLFDLTASGSRRAELAPELSQENKQYLQKTVNSIRAAYGLNTSN